MNGPQLLLLQLHRNHRVLYASQAFEAIFPATRQFAVQGWKAGERVLIDLAVAGQRQPRYCDQIAPDADVRDVPIGPVTMKRGDPIVYAVRAYGPRGHYISYQAVGLGPLPAFARHPPRNDRGVVHRLKSQQIPL